MTHEGISFNAETIEQKRHRALGLANNILSAAHWEDDMSTRGPFVIRKRDTTWLTNGGHHQYYLHEVMHSFRLLGLSVPLNREVALTKDVNGDGPQMSTQYRYTFPGNFLHVHQHLEWLYRQAIEKLDSPEPKPTNDYLIDQKGQPEQWQQLINELQTGQSKP